MDTCHLLYDSRYQQTEKTTLTHVHKIVKRQIPEKWNLSQIFFTLQTDYG